MNHIMTRIFLAFLTSLMTLAITGLPALARGVHTIDFGRSTAGTEPTSFSALVGIWHQDRDEARNIYAVDGREWEQGLLAPGAAEKARALYGDASTDFLRNLENYRYYPLTVLKELKHFREGSIEVSFKPVSGRIDQAAGIAFNIKPNGEYLVLRANALEDNLVLFRLDQGRRSTLQWIGKVPVPSNRWHTLRVVVTGKKIEGYLNGTKYVDYQWNEKIDGRIGLWSKADSFVFFDKFSVTDK
ncbi:hypothetical protein GMLC_39780 [Geomonas limicola]|uniref:3-keto-alpha-glucoside-1,2-lyase/3-keto-2-hydroxy-glucal hydratase domain-containing protein n=1 Tax=Geomonas limicola TaxID=2740186 RepID=A0A6V8NHJ9_9BACT|nr:family 16 glycoside hydrolase [Geomonas limicola]GFO70399.1 hypothetical protein GMLC_39780 [Geomonas limicola]